MESIVENVKEYYGKVLQSTADLKSKACCCSPNSIPLEVKEALSLISDEVVTRYYGCGSPLPPLLKGMTVLDLGCGCGRDVYVASKLVGESGYVIGVDMTPEQLAVARKYEDEQKERFGYKKSNVKFIEGYIEDLQTAGIEDNSVDIVISNCVINLSPYKEKVFKEIWRVLKVGGELYFSDVFADRRIPDEIASDPILHGECIGGAMYTEDFRRLMAGVGFVDFCIMSNRNIDLDNDNIVKKVGFANFMEQTIRAFKLTSLEDMCEDYGQLAIYDGSITNYPHFFDLDVNCRFFTGKPKLVSGNAAAMLADTRYASAFKVIGNRNVHYGAFACGGEKASISNDNTSCC